MTKFEKTCFWMVRGSSVVLPLIALWGNMLGGIWSLSTWLLVFGVYIVIDHSLAFAHIDRSVTQESEFAIDEADPTGLLNKHGLAIHAWLFVICFPFNLWILSSAHRSTLETIGGVASLILLGGSMTGLTAHEFVHRKNRWQRRLGTFIFTLFGYSHFIIAHIKGHHRNVGLKEDWSTARLNETAYQFLPRAIVQGYLGSWGIERRRLENKGISGIHAWMQNPMLHHTWMSFVPFAITYLFLGSRGLALHLAIGFGSIVLIEMINYVSHFGLSRKTQADGKVEKILAIHSWESGHKVTNWFLFDAGKHCHHHTDPNAPHDNLRLAFAESHLQIYLPTMVLTGFIPPLFFRRYPVLLADASQH
jgi:alkane 1-monooxygenase